MARRAIIWFLTGVAVLLFADTFFFYYRDNFSTHYPIKVFSARAFRNLEIPSWNFDAGGGQPLAGNSNTLTFYPDNLLYLFLPAHIAFNLHFLLHLAAGGWAMYALARRYGCSDRVARITALIYVASGPVISTLTFYNLVTAVALLPLGLLTIEHLIHAPGWQTALLLGSTFGLLALAAEPVTFAAALMAAAVLMLSRLSLLNRSTILFGGAAVAIAALIAAPVLIAYSEIAPELERSTWKFSTRTVLAASLTPAQMAQSFLGLYRGLVTETGPHAYQPDPGAMGWPPLFLSTFLGALVFPAFATKSRWMTPYRWMLVLCLFLALGRFNPLVHTMVDAFPAARVIRYPQKFILPMTVAGVLLIGAWIAAQKRARGEVVASVVGLLTVLSIAIAAVGSKGDLNAASKQRLIVGALIALAVLICGMAASRLPRAREAAIALTILPLLYWGARAAPIDWSRPYLRPSPLLQPPLNPFQRVARPMENEPLRVSVPRASFAYRVKAGLLDPVFGIAFGVRYGLDPSPDAMYYTMTKIVSERLHAVPLDFKLRYLRLAGCSTLISRYRLDDPSLILVKAAVLDRNPAYRYALQGAVPYVRVITETLPVRSIQEAVQLIESDSFDENAVIIPASRAGLPAAPARVSGVRRDGQRLELRVSAPEGAALVVNETYFSAWDVRAFAPGNVKGLTVFPANLDRLAFIVPPGDWRIELRFGRRRHFVAASWLLSALLLAAAAFAAIRLSRYGTASPARYSEPNTSTEAADESKARFRASTGRLAD